MKTLIQNNWKRILLAGVLFTLIVAYFVMDIDEYLTFESLKKHREILLAFVEDNYIIALTIFIFLVLLTAFFLPGIIALTLGGGFLFGTLLSACYVLVSTTLGACLAFIMSRYILGEWIQKKFSDQLVMFNTEIDRHGHNYLFVLRVIPVLPFFIINYLAGISSIAFRTFAWTSVLGMLPGSLLYSYAGSSLGSINEPSDIMSSKLVIAFLLLALFALLPVIIRFLKK
jgi:uncharacterized membrane protein YdjX (TVP38/TMEM64 family)